MIVATMGTASASDDPFESTLPFSLRDLQTMVTPRTSPSSPPVDPRVYNVYIRNRSLNMLLNCIVHCNSQLKAQYVTFFISHLAFQGE
jgi:hypothetical protein